MRRIIWIAMLLNMMVGYSQDTKTDKYYNAGYYKEASIGYAELLNKDLPEEEEIAVRKKLADCYFRLRYMEDSKLQYAKLIDAKQLDSLTLIRYIELNRTFCDYNASKGYVDVFAQEYLQCDDCDFFEDYLRVTKIYWPKKHQEVQSGIAINRIVKYPNGNIGMGYTFTDDANMIAGTHLDSNSGKTRFYDLANVSKTNNYSVPSIIKIPDYNNYYRAYPSYQQSTKDLYFTSNGSEKKKYNKKKSSKYGYSADGRNNLQIYVTKDSNDTYQQIERLGFNDLAYNYTHPSISKDGQVIYYVSDRIGGLGGYDIYYSVLENGKWSQPKNCGPKVNTPFDELTPFVTGDSLFYSSYGNNGYGGSDIFYAHINADYSLDNVTNMGLPINTCKDDFSFVFAPNGSYAMLTSNRDSKKGSEDYVYEVLFPADEFLVLDIETKQPIKDVLVTNNETHNFTTDKNGIWSDRIADGSNISTFFDNPWYEDKIVASIPSEDAKAKLKEVSLTPVTLYGQIKDAITGHFLDDVKVKLYQKQDDDTWKYIESQQSDDEGKWKFYIRKDKEYKVAFEKDDYLKDVVMIPKKNENKEMFIEKIDELNPFDLSLEPIKNNKLQIDNIYFDFNKATVRKDSYEILDNIYNYLVKNSSTKIELSAHTDCVGSDAYNLNLSKNRAKSCYTYLVAKGISKSRIVPIGYGEQQMINKDCKRQRVDKPYAQKNRRVEVKIL